MTGRELWLNEALEGQLASGVEVVLVSSGHSALDHRVFDKEAVTLAKYFPRVRVVATHAGDDRRGNVAITGLPASKSRLERFLLRPFRCLLAARGAGLRVLILHDAELLWWVPVLKLLTGWRIIYDVHEDFSQLMLRRDWIPAPLRRPVSQALELLEKGCSRLCDGVIGVTDVLVDKFDHRRHIALYNLPSFAFIEEAGKQARPLAEREYDLVHLGTLSQERLEFLKAVLVSLFAHKPDASVLLIGIHPEHEKTLRAVFPAERVTILRQVGYQEVSRLLGGCRIGMNIHPVLYPHLRCAVPVKVFEYMAAGCNVVTSYLPELHRLLGDEGMGQVTTIYTPDADRFAAEILRLLNSEELMKLHQAALSRLVRARWNWESTEEKLVEFVLNVISRKEPRGDGEVSYRQR
jgi:glycosyltransferase involved in cell wall biosynthesis